MNWHQRWNASSGSPRPEHASITPCLAHSDGASRSVPAEILWRGTCGSSHQTPNHPEAWSAPTGGWHRLLGAQRSCRRTCNGNASSASSSPWDTVARAFRMGSCWAAQNQGLPHVGNRCVLRVDLWALQTSYMPGRKERVVPDELLACSNSCGLTNADSPAFLPVSTALPRNGKVRRFSTFLLRWGRQGKPVRRLIFYLQIQAFTFSTSFLASEDDVWLYKNFKGAPIWVCLE